jgi:hypothetical protein
MSQENLLVGILVVTIVPIVYKVVKSIKSCKSPCCDIEMNTNGQTENENNQEETGIIRQLINRFTPRTKKAVEAVISAENKPEKDEGISSV